MTSLKPVTSILCGLLLVPAVADAADLVLAADGESDYQIVVPDTLPTPQLCELIGEAGQLIQRAFAANGFDVPVVSESKRDSAKPGIYLGNTKFAVAHGVDPARFEGWSYAHKVASRDLIIVGRDHPNPGESDPSRRRVMGSRVATVKGVTDFLRQYTQTHFLYPDGDVGIEFLPASVIAVPADLSVVVRPNLRFNFSYGSRFGIHGTLSLQQHLYLIANNYFPNVDFEFQAHSYPRAIPVDGYAQSDPDLFALVGGHRIVEMQDLDPHSMRHYCISNPKAQELIYQDMLKWLDAGYDFTVLGQQDGFRACQCEKCDKLYDTGADWSEKLWLFHRDLAQRLLQDRPGKRVTMLSYGHTWSPPRTFKTFPENTMILLCRTTPELLEEWSQCEVPSGYAAYLYIWGATYNALGFTPKNPPRIVGDLAKRLSAFGVKGIYMDGFGHVFGLEGPEYYVFGRMFDDPQNLQPKDLLEEYYNAAFLETAGPMRRFFDVLHDTLELYHGISRTYEDIYGRTRRHFHRDPMRLMRTLYPANTLKELDTHLKQAEGMASSPKVKSRLALIRLEFDYLRHIVTVAHLDEAYRVAPDHASRERLLDAVDAWNAFLGPHWFRWDEKKGRWGAGQHRNQIPGWPEFSPFTGYSRHAVALNHNHAGKAYEDTPLNWDTGQMRNQ